MKIRFFVPLLLGLFLNLTEASAYTVSLVTGYAAGGGLIMPSTGFILKSLQPSLAYGLLAEYKMFPKTTFDTGLIYANRGFVKNMTGAQGVTDSMASLQLPFVLRYYLLPSLACGLGGYFSYLLGNSNGYARTDSGFVLSSHLKIQFTKAISGWVDFRYLHGIQNVATDGTETYLRDLQLLFGIQFGIQ